VQESSEFFLRDQGVGFIGKNGFFHTTRQNQQYHFNSKPLSKSLFHNPLMLQKTIISPMRNNFSDFLHALQNHIAFDNSEVLHLATVTAFVSDNPHNFWQRSNLIGHVTGSAFVVNAARTHTLLLHHAKLNRWVQPGGHLDDADASPAAGALREAIEETGITNLALAATALFDIDVHYIPLRQKANESEPAHYHHDARYLIEAVTDSVVLSDESLGFRWVALTELAEGSAESGLVRMARKVLKLQPAQAQMSTAPA
jgi:8-oxo-dGTP pyrophosphatase MutT (NUDIX family)